MNYQEKYEEWLNSPYFDEDTKKELRNIQDEKEIEDRFYKDLEFGTGGLRGVIGAGSNRMNAYTVRKATQGYAQYLLENVEDIKTKGVVIAYDSRNQSDVFSKEAALILCANGIKVYLFEDLRPTPELSFAVKYLGCGGGIVITASHNPKEYNGYKIYGEDGGQIVPSAAKRIIEKIDQLKGFEDVSYMDEASAKEKELLHIISENVDCAYIEKVKGLVVRKDIIQKQKDLKIVYTPLHGTGNRLVRRVLSEIGFNNVSVVEEQELPDPQFSTVKSPNPEEHEAFYLAIDKAKKIDADVVLGTDPDCDRVGVVVKNNKGDYEVLTGNQTGALLVDYLLSSLKEQNRLPKNGALIKTIVTSKMGEVIAKKYGVHTIDTLTGFKFIGEKMKEFDEKKDYEFLFGYEESYGYLAGTFVRDKDAVIASQMICEMVAYHKQQGRTLYEALMNLYKTYGTFVESLVSITLKGKEGNEKIGKILESFRKYPPKNIAGEKVKILRDYESLKCTNLITKEKDNILLPKSNVLHFTLEDGSWCCIRPSGTEPKIKLYFSVKDETLKKANERLTSIQKGMVERIK